MSINPPRIAAQTPGARIVAAIAKQPPPPCVDRGDGKPCEFFYRCQQGALACQAFHGYAVQPQHGRKYSHWPVMPRTPSRAWFNTVFDSAPEAPEDIALEMIT